MAAGTTITTTGVLYINGKQVENTFNNLRRITNTLERDLRNLTPGTKEFIDTSNRLEESRRRFQQVRGEINSTKEALKETTPHLRSFADIGSYLGEKLSSGFNISNVSLKSLGSGIKTFAVEAWVAIGSIPIVGWMAAIVGAVGVGVSQFLKYNEELYELNKLTAQITGEQGANLDAISLRAKVFEELFHFDKKETLEAARALVEKFKITYTEALDMIEQGAIRGGAANNEYLESIREYPVFFAKAGFSVKEFNNIIKQGADSGTYSDKLPDAIKEFTLSISEQTKSTRDALVNAFGAPFADELLNKVKNGSITVKDALVSISKESDKYNLTLKQQGQLTADIFRGAGEDVGGFLEIMELVNRAFEDQEKPLTATQEILKNQVDAYKELEDAKNDALKSDQILAFKKDMELLWVNVKIYWYKGLDIVTSYYSQKITECKLLIYSFSDAFGLIPKAFSVVKTALVQDFKQIIDTVKLGGQVFKDVVTLNFDGIEGSYKAFDNSVKNTFNNTKAAAASLSNEVGNIISKNIKKINDENKIKASIVKSEINQKEKPTNNFDGSEEKQKNDKKASDAAAKKAAADLKKVQAEAKKLAEQKKKELEDSLKASAEANNRSLEAEIQFRIDKAKLLEDSYEKERLIADLERSKEFNAQRKQQDDILQTISDLEEKIANAKTPEAAANFTKALEKQRNLLSIHDQIVETSEETHQLKLKTIREKWAAKLFEQQVQKTQRTIDNNRRDREQEITDISSLEDAKAQLLAQSDLKLTDQELKAIDNLEDAKSALREAANRAMLKQQEQAIQLQLLQLSEALNDPTLSREAREKLEENLNFLKDKITQVKSSIDGGNNTDAKKVTEEQNAAKENTDILGFSAKNWEDSFKNLDTTSGKLKALGMAFQALGNAGQMFSQLTAAQNEKELRNFTKIQTEKKKELLKRLNEGYINQEEYTKETQKLEVDAANKKSELDYKQAKSDKVARIFGAIGATAQAVATALTAGPIAGPILAGIVGALGAVQVGIIASQPLPERPSFAGGGFTGDGFGSPDNTGYKPAGIVHQNEWVAPEWMTQNPRTAKVIDYLESVRLGKSKPFADGGFSSDNTTSSVASGTDSTNDSNDHLIQYLAVMSDVKELLQYLKDNGVEAWMIESAENGKRIKKTIKKFERIENSAAGK